MYMKSVTIVTLVLIHVSQSSAQEDRIIIVKPKPTIDKVLGLIGVGGDGGGIGEVGGTDNGGSSPVETTVTEVDGGGADNGGSSPVGTTVTEVEGGGADNGGSNSVESTISEVDGGGGSSVVTPDVSTITDELSPGEGIFEYVSTFPSRDSCCSCHIQDFC